MKRLTLAILFFFCLTLPAHALTVYNCDYLTGGAARALDYLSVADLSSGDRAFVKFASGVSSYLGMFHYDATGTTAENTSAHPYFVRPNDYATGGVWVELPLSWVDLQTSLTIANLTVTGTNTVTNLDASGRISGKLPVTDLATGTVTLSGISLYGGLASNLSATGEVTAYVSQCSKGMSTIISLAKDMIAGSTIWVTFGAGQKIVNYSPFVAGTTAGTSAYYLSSADTSGVSSEGISLVAVADNYWYVFEDGSPSVRSR